MFGAYPFGGSYLGQGPALTPDVVGPIPAADGLYLTSVRGQKPQFTVRGQQAGLTVLGTQTRLTDVEGE